MSLKKWIYKNIYQRDTIKLFDFIKWKLIDIYRFKKYGKVPHLFGIRCICGMYGQGKTMTMSKIGLDYRRKYGDSIYITTNFGFALQDFPISDISVITRQYDKPIIFLWDEVQNDFPATDKVFSKEVRQALTLNRKGKGKRIYWCSQDHELVHKTIRRLTIEYWKVRTLWGRYTKLKVYLKEDYEQLVNEVDVDKKRKIRPIKKWSFIQSDYIRSLYNSFGVDNGEKIT